MTRKGVRGPWEDQPTWCAACLVPGRGVNGLGYVAGTPIPIPVCGCCQALILRRVLGVSWADEGGGAVDCYGFCALENGQTVRGHWVTLPFEGILRTPPGQEARRSTDADQGL